MIENKHINKDTESRFEPGPLRQKNETNTITNSPYSLYHEACLRTPSSTKPQQPCIFQSAPQEPPDIE